MHSFRLRLWRLRFLVAALCGGLGVVLLVQVVRPAPPPTAHAVVLVTDVPAGTPLTRADVALVAREAHTVPHGAVTAPDDVEGYEAAVRLEEGQLLTGSLIGTDRPAALAPPDTVVVPVHLPDTADVLSAGDRVDLLSPPPPDSLLPAPRTASAATPTGAADDVADATSGGPPEQVSSGTVLARRALVLPRSERGSASGDGILGGVADPSSILLVAVTPQEAPALATASGLAAVLVP